MAQVIKNIGQLTKILEPKIRSTIELVAEDVKKEIDKYLQQYYDEYDPAFGKSLKSLFYQRTDQLKKCCKIGKSEISGGTVSIEVYLDIDSLHYSTTGADAYKTVVAANAGLHGGWNVSSLQSGQVSWSAISGNTGESFGSGTQIWEEPMQELIHTGKLIVLFKQCAQKRGITLL